MTKSDLSPKGIHFDPDGRLVISDPLLVAEIRATLQKKGSIELTLPPAPGGGPVPPPPDFMCGCTFTAKVPNIPPPSPPDPPKQTV